MLFGFKVFPLGLYFAIHFKFRVAFCKYKT